MISRIAALAQADVRIRMRRASTAVIFVLLSASVYAWIPDPASGSAFIVINGRRALYNSGAIGMGTASLAVIFVSLIGFYVVSNAIRRDVQSRCGYIIASTPISNGEYIVGKFAGNIAFLLLFTAGFAASSMAMLLVRAEAPLYPLPFIKQYVLLVPPSILFVSAVAILFESVPLLAGRFGDVAYFFVWAGSFVAATPILEGKGPGIAAWFDFSGMGFLLDQMSRSLHAHGMSIGANRFDPHKPLIVFDGLHFDPLWIVPRLVMLAVIVGIVGLAAVLFHRFDPARVRAGASGKRNWWARFNTMVKPLTRSLFSISVTADSIVGAAWTDAIMTLTYAPAVALAGCAIIIATIASENSLPFCVAAAAVVIADIACRDVDAGTVALIRSVPRLKEQFVWWKLLSSVLVVAALLSAPIIRAATTRPAALPALCVGILFLAAAETALGVISSSPKTWIVLFLTFWYVVVNDHGRTPALDFAGFYGRNAAGVILTYAVGAVVFIAAAQAIYAVRLRRE